LPPPPLFMSGCGCWKLQARLDLYMLGQCLFEDAMLLRSDLFIDGIPVALLPWCCLRRDSCGGLCSIDGCWPATGEMVREPGSRARSSRGPAGQRKGVCLPAVGAPVVCRGTVWGRTKNPMDLAMALLLCLPQLLINGFLTYYPLVQCSRVTPQLMPPRTLSV
jgi:hypothetical protein